MGINFIPKWHGHPKSGEGKSAEQEDLDFFASLESGHASESRLASGWWILPFAAAGLIESYFLVGWLFAHL